jgi:biopolymer transport protein ExbB/TolQ
MSDPQNNNPSGFFEVINKSTLAVSKKAAGAGVIGLVGFGAILAVAAIFFITENYFIAMLFISLALLVYATGAEIGKLMLSTMTVFFSSRHLTPKAAQLQQTLAALEEILTLRRDRDGELRVGPVDKGMRVRLPDNPLVRDLVTVQERQKGYDYAEYIVYSYYVECHELYDHSSAHLDFVAGAMPLFGLMGTVLGLISMFDSLGGVVTVEAIAPQLALALKCTLFGVVFSALYKISATRFEQRLKGLDYDYDTLARALKVIFDNGAVVEVQK